MENEIMVITKRGKFVAVLIAPSALGTIMGNSNKISSFGGVDEYFARQIDEFIEQYRPTLESLSRK